MSNSADVVIVGGGVIGLTTAYFLARSGVRCTVMDRGAMGAEASWAGAGIVPPGRPERATTPIDRLRAFSSAEFPAFSAELRELTGVDNGYRRCGGVEVVEHDDPAIDLWRAEGVQFERFVCDVEPGLRLPAGEAYFLPDVAQVRNPWHLRAVITACERVGVDLRPGHAVQELRRTDDRVDAIVTESGEEWRGEQFLLATGAWTGGWSSAIGTAIDVHPVLGQIVLFRPETPVLRRIVTVGKRYLVPRDEGLVLAGATEEPEAAFEKRNTPEAVAGLIDFATDLVPALRAATVEKSWSGLRPGSIDGLPYLGRAPQLRNVFVAAGHFRAGIQLSIGTAQAMRDLLTGKSPAIPLEAFRLGRPPAPPFVTAFRS